MSDTEATAIESEEREQWCILLPCSDSEHWAVPQNTLAEIVTLHTDSDQPPDTLEWRGESVPVLDLGDQDETPWQERVVGTGLVAVFLGLEKEKHRYWGLALRGEGLAVKRLLPGDIEEVPEDIPEHSTGAFTLGGTTYQVPDLRAIQRRITINPEAA